MNANTVQRVCILGSTGSVGVSTLDVLSRHPRRFEVFALTAHSRIDELFAQCVRWRPRFAAVAGAAQASSLQTQLRDAKCNTEVLVGPAALCDLASHPEVDSVMAATVRSAGLEPSHSAARPCKWTLPC